MSREQKIVAGISLGDINGIGIEVILKTFSDKRMFDFCTPVLFGSFKVISDHKKALNIEQHVHGIDSLNKVVDRKLNICNIWKDDVQVEIGKSNKNGGKYAYKSLDAATNALIKGTIDVLVTAPINKETIQSDDFNFSGHTEYLDRKLDGKSLMILMSKSFRIGLITGHIAISKIAETISSELIESKVNILHHSLIKDFNINKPKIAILGLNPHNGDKGVIGTEDDELIRPTINKIKETGKLVFGPYAADGFFGSKTYEQFDGILAMYHDQGLAPFKALSFGNGVNFTAGLNKIRTSPDHGTAFDLAGKGHANFESFKEALFTAVKIFKNRAEYTELTQNVLASKH